jgi:hypothetical protein
MSDYIYLGDKLTDPVFKNQPCDAIRKANGKCIRSKMSTMLVSFGGIIHNVLARRLRKLINKDENS